MAALTKVSNLASRAASAIDPSSDVNDGGFAQRLSRKMQLWFVVDIPLFIDDVGVRQLFDALSRPEFETVSRSNSDARSDSRQRFDEATLKAEAGLAPFFKASGTAKSTVGTVTLKDSATAVVQEVNRTAEMLLEKVIKFYVGNFPDRVLWTSVNSPALEDLSAKPIEWKNVDTLLGQAAPRPLIVLDLKANSKLLPMMAETVDGGLKVLYDSYRMKLKKKGTTLPDYPGEGDLDHRSKNAEYWRAWDAAFETEAAMVSVEESTSDKSRIDWIDYRLIGKLTSEDILALHLHLCPRGRYSTGTFAYQMIRRGYKHGLRIVGTLKKGEDINVLAVYEI